MKWQQKNNEKIYFTLYYLLIKYFTKTMHNYMLKNIGMSSNMQFYKKYFLFYIFCCIILK